MSENRNIVLTGLPRSGTTLTCHLLNKLPNTVALMEPIAPDKFVDLMPDYDAVIDGVEQFFARMRRMALEEARVISKHVDGVVPDNSFGEPDVRGERKSVLKKGRIPVGKPLDECFFLIVKQPGLFTALLPALKERFSCYALVRNPLSVLASRTSLGRTPERRPRDKLSAVQMYDENLKRHMASVPKGTPQWRMKMMAYSFERFRRELPEGNVIRYEEVVDSGGSALSVMVPAAATLAEPLESKNLSPLYDREVMRELGKRLLESEGAYWHFYSRESVEEMLVRLG